MNRLGHEISGTCLLLSAINTGLLTNLSDEKTRIPCAIGLIAGTFVGLYFPDLDLPTSFIGRRLKPLSILIERISRPPKSKKRKKRKKIFRDGQQVVYEGHRGPLHSVFIGLLLSLALLIPAVYIDNQFLKVGYLGIAWGFFIGYMSHLIVDLPEGIPLLYPISREDVGIEPMAKMSESFKILIVIAITVIYNNSI